MVVIPDIRMGCIDPVQGVLSPRRGKIPRRLGGHKPLVVCEEVVQQELGPAPCLEAGLQIHRRLSSTCDRLSHRPVSKCLMISSILSALYQSSHRPVSKCLMISSILSALYQSSHRPVSKCLMMTSILCPNHIQRAVNDSAQIYADHQDLVPMQIDPGCVER